MFLRAYKRWAIALVCIHALLLTHASAQETVVAVVDGRAVQSAELDALMGDRLLRLKTDEHVVRMAALNEYLDQLLISREAEKRAMSVAELLRREVIEHVPPVTEAEAHAVLDSSPRANEPAAEGQAVRAVMEDIKRRRTAKRRSEFLAALRQQFPTQIKLEAPRLTQPIAGGHSKGPAASPVSIVVFSDFQCPYCSNLDASLRRIGKEYGAQVRITSKQFPLPAHRQASKAAEAALCAADQARYWEMHEMLFTDQGAVAEEQFSELARRVGIDVHLFENCMNTHGSVGELSRDITEARSVGVSSTPTLFINGLLVVGAKPYEVLSEMVNTEIRRAALNSGTSKSR